MIRVRYFTGQVLGAADFETEQRYVVERLRRRNRWLHGWGVVEGLQVSVSRSELVVAAGFAIDCAGNEIEIGQSTAWPLPTAGKTCYLTLAFAERPVQPVAVPVDPSSGNDAGTAYSRVEEGWVLAYAPEDPARAIERLRQAAWDRARAAPPGALPVASGPALSAGARPDLDGYSR